jgi:adenosylhomocysteine nucleosidase
LLGILCATPEELLALQEVLHVAPEPEIHGPTRVWRGDGLALAQCGIGKVNAAAAATLLIDRFEADRLVFSGVAGGLNPELAVGTVLLADRLDIHDYGVLSEGRLTPTRSGIIPLGAPTLAGLSRVHRDVAADFSRLLPSLVARLNGAVLMGGVTTADYFLNCGETRAELHALLGADAIDMESGAVGQVADAWGVPLYVIRTLSDLAGEESHLTYPEMAQMAARNSATCVQALVEALRP